MKYFIRKVTIILGTMFALAPLANAAPSPQGQITIVVPFSAGASNDSIARIMAPLLSKQLKTSVIVENRAGAAGVIGANYVARAAGNGATLLLTSSTFVTTAATQPSLPYDPIKDFTPVAMIGQGPLVVAVSATKPYASLADVIENARAHPGDVNYGSAGIGSLAHLATTLMGDAANVKMTHVPYKGAANAASDLAGERLDIMLANYSSLAPLLPTGKIKLIATTAPGKHKSFPDLPSASTAIPGYDVDIWVGVFAPAGTPPELVEKLNKAFNEISQSKEMARILELDGTIPAPMSHDAFAQRVAGDLARWKKLADQHQIKAN